MRFSKAKTKLSIKEQIVSAIELMDVDRIHQLLKHEQGYLEPSFAGFVRNMIKEIKFIQSQGEVFFHTESGHCLGECNLNTSGYRFYGAKTGYYIDILFPEIENHKVPVLACLNFKVENSEKFESKCRRSIFNFRFSDDAE